MRIKFFEWIALCCKELNYPIEDGTILIRDNSWFYCFDDGMTPKQAVDEAISKGIITKRDKL